ncbi:T9SS type A sorting domain-containing protein [Neolewinella aurantiaca]|uniref:T9SS type A sorting domain-containing protein n=1 Tax=Neolewinella aurantiaca TaxID=2602767 RepID=A0A5C7FAJ3_9BACT|nr:T9SS type A sorting domain-containing protein [Neolewinella aurantiaca]TXF83085.1 T9SS type A sorting domain-containing protein [Neolewinella aurantiaca]
MAFLEVAAMGDSGPFSVEVFNSSGVQIRSFTLMIGEGRTLENICADNYLVVYTNRFGCDFIDDNIIVTECGRDDCCDDFGVYQDFQTVEPDPERCGTNGCQMGLRVSTNPRGLITINESRDRYVWSNGSTGNSLQGLCSGSYTVTATNAYGCSATQTFNLCCAGIQLGTITNATPGGSRGSVEYELLADVQITRLTLNGNPININTNRNGIDNLEPGDYVVAFRTIPGCTATARFTIRECEDLGSDTSEMLPSTSSTCGTTVNVSMDDPLRFAYLWQDGNTNRQRSLSCGIDYSVTITDRLGCGEVVKSFIVCQSFENFDLNEYISSSQPASQGESDGQVTLRLPPEFTPYTRFLMEIYDETTSMLVSSRNFPSSGTIILENLAEGSHNLRFTSDNGCSITGTVNIPSCAANIDEDDVILSNIRSIGEFFNAQATPVQIIADVEVSSPFEGYPFQYQLTYQHIQENNIGQTFRFTETVVRNSPEFYIPDFTFINGFFPTISILHPCTGVVLSQITIEELTSCTSPRPFVTIQDQCLTNNFLRRTKYAVRGLRGGRGFVNHRVSVGDKVIVTRAYNSDGGQDHSVTYEATVLEIVGPGSSVYGLDENEVGVLISGHWEDHLIRNSDAPGVLEVSIMLEDGSCLEPSRNVIGPRSQPPIPHILGGGHSLSERRLFQGIPNDFWLGYIMHCEACREEWVYFDNDYRDNASCSGDDRFALFSYEASDPLRPCTGGGTLTLPSAVRGSTGGIVGPIELDVRPSNTSELISNGRLCGCIFDPQNIEWLNNGPAIGLTLRVYAEFECQPGTVDDGPDTEITEEEIATLCERYGVARECEDCDVVLNDDGCSLDLICLEDNYVLRENIQREREGAHQGGACFFVLPDNNIQGLFDIHIGTPCEAFPCLVDAWRWSEIIDAVSSVEVERYREFPSVPECPEQYYSCGFQSGDIEALIEGGLDDYYYKSFEQDEFSSPNEKKDEFALFPNPVSERGGSISLIANRSDITEWKVFDMYGQILGQGKEAKVVGNNSQLSIGLGVKQSKMILVQIWLSSGEYYVKKIIVTR